MMFVLLSLRDQAHGIWTGSLQKEKVEGVSDTSNHSLFYSSLCFVLTMHSYNVIGVKGLGVVIGVMFQSFFILMFMNF